MFSIIVIYIQGVRHHPLHFSCTGRGR